MNIDYGLSMKLLFIRHARAEDPDVFAAAGLTDDQRPLTDDGRARMSKAVQGIRLLVPEITVVASSPYLRAVQTAEILTSVYPGHEVMPSDALTPGSTPQGLWAWLPTLQQESVITLVGHEPNLSRTISWLITKQAGACVKMKKGAACLLDFPFGQQPGSAQVQWLMTASQLGQLAR